MIHDRFWRSFGQYGLTSALVLRFYDIRGHIIYLHLVAIIKYHTSNLFSVCHRAALYRFTRSQAPVPESIWQLAKLVKCLWQHICMAIPYSRWSCTHSREIWRVSPLRREKGVEGTWQTGKPIQRLISSLQCLDANRQVVTESWSSLRFLSVDFLHALFLLIPRLGITSKVGVVSLHLGSNRDISRLYNLKVWSS